ncbi:MAG TPA: tetraacyldisaccharide 4'-kinase, partial [Ramlibacter sp.]|nr:tetraacyldisaccharide 4'-kinase [Ramlibacter sp.]
MQQALQRAWMRRGAPAWLLLPVSLAYAGLVALHHALYAGGLKKRYRARVPVVVIGNVVAGGAGKTPVVLAVLEHLRARGLSVGVVSRGYGRSEGGCHEVQPDDAPSRAGDEPLLLRRNAGVPVFVAARRAEAAAALLQAHPRTHVLVSDDGLQHHALARDIEVCVFDGRGVGNGWLLPAGPLREPWPRPVDFVLTHGGASGIPGHVMQRTLAPFARRADGTQRPLAEFKGTPVHALAGIARPDTFFAMLHAAGLEPTATHALPDHHDFAGGAPVPLGDVIVCTEKDAVKLW